MIRTRPLQLIVACALASVLIFSSNACAQGELPAENQVSKLWVHAKTYWPAHEIIEWDLVPCLPPYETAFGTVYDLDASLILNDGFSLLVDEIVTWEIVSQVDAEGAFIEADGKLYFPDYGRVFVRAVWGNFVSEEVLVWHRDMGPNPQFIDPIPRPGFLQDAPPPTPGQIKSKVNEGLTQLRQKYNFPDQMRNTASEITFRSNSDISGQNRDYLGGATPAAYYGKGRHRAPSNKVFNHSEPTIVLNDAAARSVAEDSMFNEDGRLSSAGLLVLHELVHAIGDELGINLPYEIEEVLAAELQSTIANAMIDISSTLRNIGNGTPTEIQRTRLKNFFNNIKKSIKTVRDKAKDAGGSNPAKVTRLLKALNLDDLDGNGVPDWIDNIIRGMFPDGVPDWLQEILDQVFDTAIVDDDIGEDDPDEDDEAEEGEDLSGL